ncbi:hypothetical protein MOQ_000638 [Trypanosoma cruzi marinkellei]|uniref:Uncharacterized protein n=1 Tax=Trypanosoma cruzi marinkellei TaxID=85056 RepID=K2NVW9_TRYCR|nr:hypothetical protein MOQ_000638 [Trypanosoma cruzi marinkellei]
MARMRHRSEERRKAEVRVGEREDWIKSRYADISGGVRFVKDDVLAELIAETKSSFLKLDQELSEDHNIATQRLHAAVFAHTTDFLQLFRDVNRASHLMESLKGRVQGTKAAISAISKFSTYAAGAAEEDSRAVSEVFGVSLFPGGGGGVNNSGTAPVFFGGRTNNNKNSVKARARPSLISLRLTWGGNASHKTFVTNASADSGDADGIRHHDGNKSSSSDAGMYTGGAHLVATTRSLNTPSVRLWRDATLAAGGTSASMQRHSRVRLDLDRNLGMPSSQDIALFADVLKDEVIQLLAGRQYLEAAELLRGVEETAVSKGCLPLILRLEDMLVTVIRTHLLRVPMPLMYSESLHIPLIQLLLRLGRVHGGTRLFFQLHAAWLDAEMDKMQLRMDPLYGALIASDFLVGAVQEVLLRQQNLWNAVGLKAERKNSDYSLEKDEVCVKKDEKVSHGATTTTNSTNNNNNNNNKGNRSTGYKFDVDEGGTGNNARVQGQPGMFIMPPNSAAVLWVRERVDKLARDFLGARALSYGIGAEGGDPSRFRRAVVMAADAIRTVRRMDDSGYAGCDTHLLRLLTPSLVYLQADFSVCTDSRLESTGRAMVEHLIRDARLMYKTHEAAYSPKMCEEVARRNNSGCRELYQRLRHFPRTSYAVLLEFLLVPASSSLFTKKGTGGEALAAAKQLLSPEKYTFLRYANGCTRSHGLFLLSLIRFVAAMTGKDSLPLEQMGQQLTKEPNGEARGNQLECVSFLLSNALVIESLDITMQRLFLSFLRTTLRQRQALVTFLKSAEFLKMHRQLFCAAGESSTTFSSYSTTRWLIGAMQLLLADVLSASVWVAFLSRGGALSYMLCDAALVFCSQYMEELRRVLPCVVQGWMAAILSLAHNINTAQELLIGDDALLLSPGYDATAAGVTNGRDTSSVAAAAASYVEGGNGSHEAASQLLQAAAVDEAKLTPFLMELVRGRFSSHTGEEFEATWLGAPLQPSSSPLVPLLCGLRHALGNYPHFPMGGDFDHSDELFLFHWCVQISLNTLAFFQEHFVLPSHVVNGQRAAQHGDPAARSTRPGATGAPRYPLRGCVSPQEESVLGALAAGGGNYVSGLALLQFIVFRLLRDVLCRIETWSAVYGLLPERWRQSESILRQQLFFFALFVRVWTPLFVGGSNSTPQGRPAMTNMNGNIDGAPALVILQWLTCTTRAKGHQKEHPHPPQRHVFDVEGLTFSSTGFSPTQAPPVSREMGTWRSQKNNVRGGDHNRQEQGAMEGKPTSLPNKNPAGTSSLNNGNTTANTSSDDTGPSMLLLDVIGSFFDALQEPRALPAITSEVTRVRVERVLASVDLAEFAQKAELGRSEDEDDDDDGDDDSVASSSTGTSTTGTSLSTLSARAAERAEESSRARVTLLHFHDLLVYYLAPLL